MSSSIRATLDREMNEAQQEMLRMGELVEQAIAQAMEALKKNDQTQAANVISGDKEINILRYKIEEQCLTIIATQQPIAGDLRAIVAIMHSVVELERIADYAAGIGKIVIKMSDEKHVKPLKKIMRMSEMSRTMLQECLQAFATRNTAQAREIAMRDSDIDRLYREVVDRLIQAMSKRSAIIPTATYMMWCAHNLERIADRVTNLSEQIIFLTTGEFNELEY